jgi:thiol-disulfide isomerase/thioredoxin
MPSPRQVTVLLSVALLLACGLVVVLGKRQIELNRAYVELKRRASQPHEGYGVPAFLAHTLAGDTVTVGEIADSSARQVLFVLTTTCPYCKATLPVWAGLADSLHRLGGGKVRVLALSLASLRRAGIYVTEHRIRYPVATFPSDKFRRLYRAGSVPQTVVLDASGQVLFAHVGRLTAGPVLDSIYRAVGPRPAAPSGVAVGATAGPTALAGARP